MAFHTILLVGCGNMAGAMLEGWLAGGLDPARFTVVEPSDRALPDGIVRHHAVPPTGDFDAILLGVKPQMLGAVAPEVARLAGPRTTILSLLAGVELATLAERFPAAAAHVRVMPNLAVALGKAPIALAERGLDEGGREVLLALMRPLGTPEWVGEAEFDLVTALTGSGPGFVYRFIDALASAAADLGLPREQAERMALAMVEGAAALAAASTESPGKLADRVASPGGMTREGLNVLDADGALVALVTETLRAARDRGAELAAEARGQR
uniref:pyrroline-5-carboxylate reductase family protein n=1 Tax=Altererythrobacter segetis TaxID=1104773 RepID=UPI00140A32D6|nr:pyrroline-5-carboxylate reductase dimerization domain-containing protein [Altererythrobacter segetis]